MKLPPQKRPLRVPLNHELGGMDLNRLAQSYRSLRDQPFYNSTDIARMARQFVPNIPREHATLFYLKDGRVFGTETITSRLADRTRAVRPSHDFLRNNLIDGMVSVHNHPSQDIPFHSLNDMAGVAWEWRRYPQGWGAIVLNDSGDRYSFTPTPHTPTSMRPGPYRASSGVGEEGWHGEYVNIPTGVPPEQLPPRGAEYDMLFDPAMQRALDPDYKERRNDINADFNAFSWFGKLFHPLRSPAYEVYKDLPTPLLPPAHPTPPAPLLPPAHRGRLD